MEHNYALLLLYFPILISTFILGFIIPFLNKETIIFGVRIPDEEISNPMVEQLKRNFRHNYLATMIPYSIVLALSLYEYENKSILSLGIILSVFFIGYLYVLYNHKMAIINNSIVKKDVGKKEQIIVVDTGFREGKYLIPFAWFTPSLIIIIFCFLFITLNYDKIPATIPIKFNFDGNAILFTAKTCFYVFLMPVSSIINLLLFVGIYFVIKRAKQQTSSNYPEKSKLQDRKFRYLWSGYIVILAFILSAFFVIISLKIDQLINLSGELFTIINIVVPNVVLIGAIILAIKTGQSGSRLKFNTGETANNYKIADDNFYWKLGMFYYNPDDPAFMVPKRMGIGWTFNFGHPISFIILIALIAVPLIIKIFSK
ncbi:MAG: DUF1648 domain-containing protein [Ignavibacteriaceae bacterium]